MVRREEMGRQNIILIRPGRDTTIFHFSFFIFHFHTPGLPSSSNIFFL